MSCRQLVVKGQELRGKRGHGQEYSWPSISVGSAFLDSTNYGLKIFKKIFSGKSQKAKLEFALLATIYIAFILYLQVFT